LCYMPRPSHSSWLSHSNYTWRRVQGTVLYILIFMFLADGRTKGSGLNGSKHYRSSISS
jgi:hypothetical protein